MTCARAFGACALRWRPAGPGTRPWPANAVSAETGAPIPPPGVPGPFSLADPDELARLLHDAALTDVVVTVEDVPMRAGSFEEWWMRTCALAGPLARILASLSEEAAQAI